jgi:hypothetical protein
LPSGEIQFIHPKDGVFPEKVNEGRVAVGKREFSIGKIQIQLLLNLLGQVPLIRKVSNSKFSFEVHFSKETSKEKKKEDPGK